MTEIEVMPAAERIAPAEEPRLTLSELQSLLRDAAALEAARRPIILAPPTEAPVSAQVAKPTGVDNLADLRRHPGIDVTVPAETVLAPAWANLRHRAPAARGWGKRVALAGALLTLTGAGDGAVSSQAALPAAIAGIGLLTALAGLARAIAEQQRQEV